MERIFSLIVKVILQALGSSKKSAPDPEPEEPAKVKEEPTPEPVKEEKVVHQKKYLWLLDNGHGETTPGKRSPKFDDGTRMFEYEFNRAIVARIKNRLDEIGVAYLDLVPGDNDVTLGDRVALWPQDVMIKALKTRSTSQSTVTQQPMTGHLQMASRPSAIPAPPQVTDWVMCFKSILHRPNRLEGQRSKRSQVLCASQDHHASHLN